MKSRLSPARFKYKEEFHTRLCNSPRVNDYFWMLVIDNTEHREITDKWLNPATPRENLLDDYKDVKGERKFLLLYQYQEISKGVVRPIKVFKIDLKEHKERGL